MDFKFIFFKCSLLAAKRFEAYLSGARFTGGTTLHIKHGGAINGPRAITEFTWQIRHTPQFKFKTSEI